MEHLSKDFILMRVVKWQIQISVGAGYVAYWIAAIREGSGGLYDFYWAQSKRQLTFNRWRANQPDQDSAASNCVLVSKIEDWEWDDTDCSVEAMYMCSLNKMA